MEGKPTITSAKKTGRGKESSNKKSKIGKKHTASTLGLGDSHPPKRQASEILPNKKKVDIVDKKDKGRETTTITIVAPSKSAQKVDGNANKESSSKKALKKNTSKVINTIGSPGRAIVPVADQGKIWRMYDSYRMSINPYLQTLLNPWKVTGVKVPQGDLASTSFSVRQRYTFDTDASGNLFIWLGTGPSLADGQSPGVSAVGSQGTSCSLLPNIFKYNDTDSGESVSSYIIGGVSPFNDTVSVDTTDLFNHTKMTNIKLNCFNPSVTPSFIANIDQFRLVSSGVSLIPLGPPISLQGSVTAAFIPRDGFAVNQTLSDLGAITSNDIKELPYSAFIPLNKVTGATSFWRPTDEVSYEYVPIAKGTDFFNTEEHPEYITGGWVILVENCVNSGAEPRTTFVLDLVANYEGLPHDINYAPGLTDTHPDEYMLEHTDEVLGTIPSVHEGTDSIPGDPKVMAPLPIATWRDNIDIHQSVAQDLSFRSGRTRVNINGPRRLGGLKEFVGGIGDAYNKYRPMLDKIINEWGPVAAKIAMGVATLL